MIHNKSIHPIEVKKISVRIWALRDEIEAALERRIKECEAAGVPLYIDDIKKFYKLETAESQNISEITASPDEVKPPNEEAQENTSLKEAEAIVAQQQDQGVDNKPNPILDRPYVRQAPDSQKISYGFSFLADIHMDSALVFTKDKFLHGQSVVVEFLIPETFMMSAEISYSHNFGRNSRIISETKPDYRVQCQFKFIISGERDNLRNFLVSIQPTIPTQKKKVQKQVDLDSLEI